MQTYLQKRGARNLVRLGETIVRSSGAVAFCTPYTVCVLPELCGPEFEHYSSVPLCSRPPFIKTTQYSWTSLCETHNAHAMGHGAAPDISWTMPTDQIDPPDHSVCTLDQEHCCRGLTVRRALCGVSQCCCHRRPRLVPCWRPLNHWAGSNPKQTSLIHRGTLVGWWVVQWLCAGSVV